MSRENFRINDWEFVYEIDYGTMGMRVVDRDENINTLNIRWGIITALKRSGIHTIKDLLECDVEKLARIRSMDTGDINKIRGFYNQVVNHRILVADGDSNQVFQPQPDEKPKHSHYFDGVLYHDVPVR